jgi:hypothetical protein
MSVLPTQVMAIPVKEVQIFLAAFKQQHGEPAWKTLAFLGVVGTPFFLKDFNDDGMPTADAVCTYREKS